MLNPIDLRFQKVQRRIVGIRTKRLVNSRVSFVKFLIARIERHETVESHEICWVELQRRFKEPDSVLGFLLANRGHRQVVVNTRIVWCHVARGLKILASGGKILLLELRSASC